MQLVKVLGLKLLCWPLRHVLIALFSGSNWCLHFWTLLLIGCFGPLILFFPFPFGKHICSENDRIFSICWNPVSIKICRLSDTKPWGVKGGLTSRITLQIYWTKSVQKHRSFETTIAWSNNYALKSAGAKNNTVVPIVHFTTSTLFLPFMPVNPVQIENSPSPIYTHMQSNLPVSPYKLFQPNPTIAPET